jgi:hypothetical protein
MTSTSTVTQSQSRAFFSGSSHCNLVPEQRPGVVVTGDLASAIGGLGQSLVSPQPRLMETPSTAKTLHCPAK